VDARLAARIKAGTQMLLVGEISGQVAAWFAPGTNELTVMDGRGLAAGLLGPLFGTQMERQTSLLDVRARSLLDRWPQDARGDITPRQLLWQLSGLKQGAFVPLNPWSRRAQLASGPDFERAALHTHLLFPPGTHFEPAAANAQLLAVLASRAAGTDYAALLQRHLWSQFAAQDAVGMLDHRRGQMAAHCCLRAAAADWLRLGLLLAAGGRVGQRQVLPAGFVKQMATSSPVHPGYGLGFRLGEADSRPTLLLETQGRRLAVALQTGRAVLWVGTGAPPAWLDELLSPTNFALQDSTQSE
jgi:CubicO group peptidase (beta-lactamase class C family)